MSKGKVVPVDAAKVKGGGGAGVGPRTLFRHYIEVSGLPTAPAALPPHKERPVRRWVGIRVGQEALGKTEICRPGRESKQDSSVVQDVAY
jgi:hypothetical protein